MQSVIATSANPWTSLEVAKLLIQALIPLTVFALGILFSRRAKQIEAAVSAQQTQTEWRQQLLTRTVPRLNKLYCAFNYVGGWERFAPQEIIDVKRELDGDVYTFSPLLAEATLSAYRDLMNSAFETGRGRGKKIRLRANIDMYQELETWRDEYGDYFVLSNERLTRDSFRQKYDHFVKHLFNDAGISKEKFK